ncbi:thioesterase [Pseudoxanthomonas kalamensis DSM 18571]|uniref:acyl-CoA thioesterase n=1 Tax=Pseudoxanthomonas kalamensis TaxID=289483 RepID=UPI001391C2D8|nr:thioesterase family protein [Pseudoxanthomonas kalamensis]KAF1710487.1 thioesterase [Pseudoxanthomonas kalamensis DSM 18571]
MNTTDSSPRLLARIPLSVRWRDMDSFGHVNNAMYLSYIEEARVRWLATIPGFSMQDRCLPVLVNADINYRRPITWPAELMVELFIMRLGSSSVTIGHRILDADDESVLYCDGSATAAWIDTHAGKSVPLPDAIRAASS